MAQPNSKPLLLLIALTSINHTCYAGVSFALTLYAVQLHASPFQIGLLIALLSLFGSLTSVIAGRWADRIGPRTPMLVSSVAMVAGAAVGFVWRELAALFVVSAMVGTAYNVYFVAQQQLLGQYGSLEDRVRTFSMSGLGISIANFIGPLWVGWTLKQIGFADTFAVLALLPAIPFAFIAMNRLPIAASRSASTERGKADNGGVLKLLRDRELRLIYATALFGTITSQLFTFLMPLYGISLGLDAFHIGLIIGSFALASAVARLIVPFISKVLTPWSMLIGALAGAALCFMALVFIHALYPLMVVGFFLGLSFGTCNPTAQALLYEAAPPDRAGEVLGLRIMMAGGIQTLVPMVAGAAMVATGIGPIFGGFSALLFGCCYMGRSKLRKPAFGARS